jgi:heptosyltransferase-2
MRLVAHWLGRWAALPDDRSPAPLPDVVRTARGILVVALAEAGDLVLLSPFLRELRRLAPAAHITLVCLPALRTLFDASSDVDEVLGYDARMPRLARPLALPRRARAFAKRQLVGRFDLAIVPRWDTDHHLATAVALFSGAPRRVWHSEHSNPRKETLNAGFDALYTDVVRSRAVAHEVERHLAMLGAMGATAPSGELRLFVSDADRRAATDALGAVGAGSPIVAFGIGAAHPKRRLPVSRFAEIGRKLHEGIGAQVVVIGGRQDIDAQQELLRALGPSATGFAGRSTLLQSAAVLERCRLFIGSDSAPMHLAAAMGVPCVEISCHPAGGDPLHNNAPERFSPWGVPSEVVRPARAVPPCTTSCSASAAHCILTITAAMVWGAARDLLRRTSDAGFRGASGTSR